MIMSAAMRCFSKGLKNEFAIAVFNEPLVFEPLKLNCNVLSFTRHMYRMILEAK